MYATATIPSRYIYHFVPNNLNYFAHKLGPRSDTEFKRLFC